MVSLLLSRLLSQSPDITCLKFNIYAG